ncbi:MAG: hypothetical protein WC464_07170 [Bdellovibrionales bacterium]
MKHRILSLIVLSLSICLISAPALAKKPHQPKAEKDMSMSDEWAPEEAKKNWSKHEKTSDAAGVAFDDDEKDSIRSFMKNERQRKCPPGLAKKKTKKCLPPGLSKKYEIGGPLPAGHRAPPPELLERLGPAPAGAFYSMIDDDVVIASEKTKKVLDAVTLLSAME